MWDTVHTVLWLFLSVMPGVQSTPLKTGTFEIFYKVDNFENGTVRWIRCTQLINWKNPTCIWIVQNLYDLAEFQWGGVKIPVFLTSSLPQDSVSLSPLLLLQFYHVKNNVVSPCFWMSARHLRTRISMRYLMNFHTVYWKFSEDFGCVTMKFTRPPHKGLWYFNNSR